MYVVVNASVVHGELVLGLRQRLFHPKYGGCVYKVQVAVNFLGWICYWSGLHEGNINDNVSKRVLVQSDCDFVQVIFAATLHEHPLRSWEFWCGDGIYHPWRLLHGSVHRRTVILKSSKDRISIVTGMSVRAHDS